MDQGSGLRRENEIGDTGRKKQPNAGVIHQDLADVKEKNEVFVKALSTLIVVCDSQEEKDSFEQHLIIWAEYVTDVRSRAAEVLHILEAPVDRRPVVPTPQTTAPIGTTFAMTSTTHTANELADAILARTTHIQNQPELQE